EIKYMLMETNGHRNRKGILLSTKTKRWRIFQVDVMNFNHLIQWTACAYKPHT
ncbi:hypothetical protein MKX01_035734, partial [Papaver californicum]